MTEVRCRCGRRVADKGVTAYEINIKSGKSVSVSFPEGTVICPKCGTVLYLEKYGSVKTDEVEFV
jgi:3D (Asp-Asp-Asp) domain-containing protein